MVYMHGNGVFNLVGELQGMGTKLLNHHANKGNMMVVDLDQIPLTATFFCSIRMNACCCRVSLSECTCKNMDQLYAQDYHQNVTEP